jgi:hypothetical protein
MGLEGQLRSTSDTLLTALEELGTLERRKREMQPGDPALVTISTRIEEIAEQVLGASVAQRDLTEQVSSEVQEGSREPSGPSIAQTPSTETGRPMTAAEILREWRLAEGDLAGAAPGSEQEAHLRAQCEDLRRRYLAVFQENLRRPN